MISRVQELTKLNNLFAYTCICAINMRIASIKSYERR